MFEDLAGWLGGDPAAGMTHAELEDEITERGRLVMRQLLSDHLAYERYGKGGWPAGRWSTPTGWSNRNVEPGHARVLCSVFGLVILSRVAYRASGRANLHPFARRDAQPAGGAPW